MLRRLRSGQGSLPSLILWGPPGSGKTTLAKLIGKTWGYDFIEFSAVLQGVKDIRSIVAKAQQSNRKTLLFVDEIHRFSKSQQDAFLPHVENGTIILIGATTENPSFYVNGALLSRSKLVQLKPLDLDALELVLKRAEAEFKRNLTDQARSLLASSAGGDARRALHIYEYLLEEFCEGETVSREALEKLLSDAKIYTYDKQGDAHYDLASAFIKSMRGSDPDAALYWAFRIIEGGGDPRFVLRRMMIFASEDIGNAYPEALQLAVATLSAYETLGLPEARIPIAHCITMLACAPKSNRSYLALNKALEAVKQYPSAPVPLHLRNAPTKAMKELGYGQGYEYAHNKEDGAVSHSHLPQELSHASFYEASDHGLRSS